MLTKNVLCYFTGRAAHQSETNKFVIITPPPPKPPAAKGPITCRKKYKNHGDIPNLNLGIVSLVYLCLALYDVKIGWGSLVNGRQ